MALIDELKKYYADLLVVQYQTPKARAEIELYASVLFPINQGSGNLLIKDVTNGFDIDTAVGAQLDIIAIYVDLVISFLVFDYPAGLYLGLVKYIDIDDPVPSDAVGITDYAEFPDKDGRVLLYDDIKVTLGRLPDEAYRTLLKLKIVTNHSNGSRRQISDSLYESFGDDIQLETGPEVMTIIYKYAKKYESLMDFAIEDNLLPKPAGVKVIPQIVG